jgi:CubicO group peptidase (beta-lactamase class C family)
VQTLDPALLHDREFLQQALFDLKPISPPGAQQAYHALTGGFILAEVMRKVTGESLPELLDTHFRRPLGLKTFTFGVVDTASPLVAVDSFTGPDPLPPEAALLRRAFGKNIREIVAIANDPRFRTGVVPSGNLFATANEISLFFEMLRRGGRLGDTEVLNRSTVRRARLAREDVAFDHMLLIPIRYSTAFMLGGEYLSLFGPRTPEAFGHLGFTNVMGWADAEREISVALLNNGKPFVTLKLLAWLNIMRVIASAFPRTST